MKRVGLLVILLFESVLLTAQIRMARLEVRPKEVFELKESDILVVDTLILRDSSGIVLNKLKQENFIHAKKIIVGRGCFIDGKGVPGIKGRTGRNGNTPASPCSTGGTGGVGTEGTNGGNGLNLFLSFSDVKLNGTLLIDVSGGDAGDGGQGGPGGGGGTGTRLCAGGSGGYGGKGSNGGIGGNSGNVTFHAPSIPELRLMLGEKIIVRNYGGQLGTGGEGGRSGFAGLSPTGKSNLDGKSGRKGAKGKDGVSGKPGSVIFQDK